MPTRRCLNCQTPTLATSRFCDHCGQRTDTLRLTFADIFRDLMHTFVNVERGPLAFAWSLLLRPGVVAREYVEGKRRRHYGPFATLAVIVGVAALVNELSGFRPLSHDGLPPGPTDLLQRHFNMLLLLQLPFVAGASALVFRRVQLTLPEHLVLAAYTLSVQAVVLIVLLGVAFADSTVEPHATNVLAFWLGWYLYYGWAASQFYGRIATWPWARGSISAMLGHGLLVAALFASTAAYEAAKVRFWPDISSVSTTRGWPQLETCKGATAYDPLPCPIRTSALRQ